MITFSPSNVKTAKTCLRKFQAQYVTKEIVAKFDSPAATRGIILHGLLESSVKHGHHRDEQEIQVNKNKRLVSWADYPKEESRCLPAIERFAELKAAGWGVKTEFEAAVNSDGKVCGWWDKDCFARAKLDVVFVPPDRNGVFVWDWKTGKAANINEFQMPFTAMILASILGPMRFDTVDYLIDSDDSIKEQWSPGVGIIQAVGGAEVPLEFMPTVNAIRDLRKAYEFDQWPATKNRLCNWCEIKNRCMVGK